MSDTLPDSPHQRITSYGKDTTVRWSTRAGDIVVWFGYQFPAPPESAVTVNDVWMMRDGESVLFTNRLCDIPPWFGLCIEEMTARLSEPLMENFTGPDEPLDGPNVWRVGSGSRVAWVRPSLGSRNPEESIVQVLNLRANALVLGVTSFDPFEHYMNFGAPGDPSEEVVLCTRAAYRFVQSLGCPRELSIEWLFGA